MKRSETLATDDDEVRGGCFNFHAGLNFLSAQMFPIVVLFVGPNCSFIPAVLN